MSKAIEHCELALVIAHEMGDRRGEGIRLGNLGNVYADLGEVSKAIELLERAHQIGVEIQDPVLIRVASEKLAELSTDDS